jgi:leucyl aminopeptidase (aminopeptidase T)
VNEKIANMMHVAMGSGFEADTSTTYHTDVVFDAPGQRIDAYGVDAKGKKHWIVRRGKSVFW